MHPELLEVKIRQIRGAFLLKTSSMDAVSTMFLTVEKPRITIACVIVLIRPGKP